MSKYFAVINMRARRARQVLATNRTRIRLEKLTGKANIVYVTDKRNLNKKLRLVKENLPRVLIIGGGDGTLLSAIDMIAGTKTKLGILPLGTANNLARNLNIPHSFKKALEVIENDHSTISVPLGKVNDRFFASMATIGLSAQVSVDTTAAHKLILGSLSYFINALPSVFKPRSFFSALMIDGNKFEIKAHEIIIANAALYLPLNFTFEHSIHSNELLVVVFPSHPSMRQNVSDFLNITKGRAKYAKQAVIRKGRNIEIATRPVLPIACDGEIVSKSPLRCEIVPNAINIICPQKQEVETGVSK